MANSKALTLALLLGVLLWAVCSAASERDLDVSLNTLPQKDLFLMTHPSAFKPSSYICVDSNAFSFRLSQIQTMRKLARNGCIS